MAAEITDVIYADRGRCYDDDRRRDYGSGWGAVGGALVGGGFGAAAVSVWDKVNDTKASIEGVKATVQEARAGIYKDISDKAEGTNGRIAGAARGLLNHRFATERTLCDLGYKVNNDIRDAKDANLNSDRAIMERLYNMERSQSDCCCEVKGLIREIKSDIMLQAERNHCETMAGQKDLACLIKDQAKDQEIARLNRELKHKDDVQLNQKLNFLIQREIGGTAAATAV